MYCTMIINCYKDKFFLTVSSSKQYLQNKTVYQFTHDIWEHSPLQLESDVKVIIRE